MTEHTFFLQFSSHFMQCWEVWRVQLDLIILLPSHHFQVCPNSGTSLTTHQPHWYFPFHSLVIFIFFHFSHPSIPVPLHITSWNKPLATFYLRDIFKLISIQNIIALKMNGSSLLLFSYYSCFWAWRTYGILLLSISRVDLWKTKLVIIFNNSISLNSINTYHMLP